MYDVTITIKPIGNNKYKINGENIWKYDSVCEYLKDCNKHIDERSIHFAYNGE
jgi:hypothetical protein